MKRILLSLVILLISSTVFATGAPLSITPIQSVPAVITSGQTVNSTYAITNNTNSLTYYEVQGITGNGLSLAPNNQCTSNQIAANSTCILSLNLNTTGLPLGAYTDTIGVNYGAAYIPSYTIKSTIIAKPPTTIPVTVTLSGDLGSTNQSVGITLTNIAGGSGPYTNTVLANTQPQTFANMTAGTYSAPASVTVNGTAYTLQSTNSFTVSSTQTNVTLNYQRNPTPPTTIPVTMTITGDLTVIGSSVPITLTNTSTSTPYGPINIVANGRAQTFDNIPAGSYNISPVVYNTGSNIYNLKNIGPFTVSSTQANISLEYDLYTPPPGGNYDWHQSHLTTLQDANIFAVLWGGGSTTAPVKISTNPPINPWLNAQIAAYENSPASLNSNATVQGMPSYIAMGTVTEVDNTPSNPGSVTQQLEAQHLDLSFHYEGNGAGNRGCFFDDNSCPTHYTPEVGNMAKEAATVTANNGHTLVSSEVFYTIDFSDGTDAIQADTENDTNLTAHIYNLMVEAQLMQQQYEAGHQMVLFLNPDAVFPFQACGQYYCPIAWKPGFTDDPAQHVVANPNVKNDFDAAISRMVTMGYLDQTTANTYMANIGAVITVDPNSGRTTYGLPEIDQMYNWIVITLAPNVPFGWGLNAYDNANLLMNPGEQNASWETSAITWIHKVNYTNNMLGSTPYTEDQAVQFESAKLASYIKDMNFVGNTNGQYKPDFIYFDIYERDPIPGYVQPGFLFNGVDWDTYLDYIKYTDQAINNMPVALWQMPGASLQTAGNTFSGVLAGTIPDWTFGDPNLNNDFSNIAPSLGLANIVFTTDMNNYTYFTAGKNVNNVIQYLELNG
jgi:hypothetical protein